MVIDDDTFPGMSRAELDAIWQGVKANSARLKSCKSHDFAVDTTPDRPLGKKWRCTACGGTVDAMAKYWYEMGRAHAAGRDHE